MEAVQWLLVVDLAVRGRETHKRWVHAWGKVEELGVAGVHGGSHRKEGELLVVVRWHGDSV